MAAGDRHALRDVADWLQPFDDASVSIYAARTGKDAGEIGSMLDRETWIGGEASVAQGFADDLLASDAASSGSKPGGRADAAGREKGNWI